MERFLVLIFKPALTGNTHAGLLYFAFLLSPDEKCWVRTSLLHCTTLIFTYGLTDSFQTLCALGCLKEILICKATGNDAAGSIS